MSKRRYVVVGAGGRVRMYLGAIAGDHAADAELVGLLDSNPGRIAYHLEQLQSDGFDTSAVVTGSGDDLEKVIADRSADRVIITSPDFTHADYIVRGLNAGVDVVVEKPLTINPASARAIVEAVDRTGNQVVVTHNYRYSPRNSALKELIKSGTIGRVLSVTFEWVLDTAHGADYFRRWHRDKANSGGLLIHKASHHFDLVNWWIADVPQQVYARGGVRFYGDAGDTAKTLPDRQPRGTHDGPHTPWELDLRTDDRLKATYLDNESYDGYLRDQDVFGPGVTTEDNLAVIVDYAAGPTLSYALNAHSPWEGYRVAVNGTEGRAELEVVERAAVLTDGEGNIVVDPSALPEGAGRQGGQKLTLQRHWQPAEEITITEGSGGHGGGDVLLLRDVFQGPGDDPLERPSDYKDGLRSISVGMMGNESLATGRPITLADLDLGVDLAR
ncbi:Gfo/Idh/MocA family protein [Microlunatus soli]|uniref:Oxidoreductase family, C-terminal alpha/beta domain n=1 Tax=Microlunatus soli TaxID=630515 RepID=A0A1H1YSU3_9ACTN|nr:Gfo/Idh/MocA family oxidoreductase [Microlunatus soli]SDT24595.1 Oxidoreductase family, C-terminal alpha/beta domain [Microlunatus soli]